MPTPEGDGTVNWSPSTFCRSLRAPPDGLPRVSADIIREVLLESGASSQCTPNWCPAGSAVQ